MSGSVNKVIRMIDDYRHGKSLTEVSAEYGLSISTVRYHIKKNSALRTRADGVRNAASKGKLGSGFRGKRRVFLASHKENIREARLKWGEKNSIGISLKPSGYLEYTRGINKGRSVHVVEMERRLGRRLRSDEHVHHIDGEKLNNQDNNLALVTVSGHMRLHQRERRLTKTGV